MKRQGLAWRIAEQMLVGCACLDPAAMLMIGVGSEPSPPAPLRERSGGLRIIPLRSSRFAVRPTPDPAAQRAQRTSAR
jgi:hypothetical protein